LVGDYTKRQAEFMKLDKTYWAEVILGANSDTDDIDGQLTPVKVTRKPNRTQIESVLLTQVGQLLQLPPKYSAIKQGGQKAYELARKGKIVDLKPRPVIVYSISDIEYDWPYLAFRANVSSGTYIRSIARDVGSKLKTGAYLSQLRRETIGDFSLADAITIEKLELAGPAEHLKQS
jgi:tRNA pseudouridine55 synthase